jgi:hypothetical protein
LRIFGKSVANGFKDLGYLGLNTLILGQQSTISYPYMTSEKAYGKRTASPYGPSTQDQESQDQESQAKRREHDFQSKNCNQHSTPAWNTAEADPFTRKSSGVWTIV